MKDITKWLRGFGVLVAALILPAMALAQDAGKPPAEVVSGLYPGAAYSPYAARSFPSQVFWGDTHVHTALSLDAGLFGNTLGHEEAYRFARGEQVTSATGLPVKLSRPLDWLVVTDHSDMMGIATDIQNGAPNILAEPKGREWHDGFKAGGAAAGVFGTSLPESRWSVPWSAAGYGSRFSRLLFPAGSGGASRTPRPAFSPSTPDIDVTTDRVSSTPNTSRARISCFRQGSTTGSCGRRTMSSASDPLPRPRLGRSRPLRVAR